jgi:hypothetical protein
MACFGLSPDVFRPGSYHRGEAEGSVKAGERASHPEGLALTGSDADLHSLSLAGKPHNLDWDWQFRCDRSSVSPAARQARGTRRLTAQHEAGAAAAPPPRQPAAKR